MIKYIIIGLTLGALLFSSCGQQLKMVKTSKTDSLAVEAVWKQYVRAIANRNTRTLKKLSLQKVYCEPCAIQANTGNDLFLADVYIRNVLVSLPRTKLWQAVKTTKHLIVTERIKNYKPQNINVNDDLLNVYDIWYVTRQPDKIKFFGLTAIK
jgi:hypothetical protein